MAKSDSRRGSINARLRMVRQNNCIEENRIDLALGFRVPNIKVKPEIQKPEPVPQEMQPAFS